MTDIDKQDNTRTNNNDESQNVSQTNIITSTLDESLFDADDTIIDLSNTRMIEIPLNLPLCTESLALRQNELNNINNISHLNKLTNLDLYLNNITTLQYNILPSSITILDLSFNNIHNIDDLNLSYLVNLQEIYLIHNKISNISGLEHCKQLNILELGSNKLRNINNIDNVVNSNIQQLYLGKNKIAHIDSHQLSQFNQLHTLSIPSNRLTSLDNIFNDNLQHTLTELYISHNGLTVLNKSLYKLINLKILDISGNKLVNIDGLQYCIQLEELWCSDNNIDNWATIDQYSNILTKLHTIYLERNPIQTQQSANIHIYREHIKAIFTQIKQIDADVI